MEPGRTSGGSTHLVHSANCPGRYEEYQSDLHKNYNETDWNAVISACGKLTAYVVDKTGKDALSDIATYDVSFVDCTPPDVTAIKVPDGLTRNTHTTGIQFTLRDNESGIGPAGPLEDGSVGRVYGAPRSKL